MSTNGELGPELKDYEKSFRFTRALEKKVGN